VGRGRSPAEPALVRNLLKQERGAAPDGPPLSRIIPRRILRYEIGCCNSL